jgi:3,4-dihydroxy 2-butanone 4-phosphate synthase/GTP cyclohydrolase II
MARLPDLLEFAETHGLKVGTIADLIHYRSQNESLVRRVTERPVQTAHGEFQMMAFLEKMTGQVHLALTLGDIRHDEETLVRVHQPLSLIDLLDMEESGHSWTVPAALGRIAREGKGVLVLLNCSTSVSQLIDDVAATLRRSPHAKMDLLTYGIGAQILRELNVGRMRLLATQRKIPSMTGFGLEVCTFEPHPGQVREVA